jgi:hypothetical protein
MVEWVWDTETKYRTLKENAIAMGVDDKVTQRGTEIQKLIGEENCPWEDAYEMAWNELISERKW